MSQQIILHILLTFCIQNIQILNSYSTDINRPNIFFILGDDWGWNDVGFNNASDVSTPNLDYYAKNGLILHKYYTQNVCTQSRAALLTGRYPSSIGMQHYILSPGDPYGLPLDIKLLPEALKENGYKTHMIGKWHLGYSSWKYYPLNRGFDTFMGFLNGEQDYTLHNYTYSSYNGKDFREEYNEINASVFGTYLYTDRILNILDESAGNNEPFFIYGAVQLIHKPKQAPEEYIRKFNDSIERSDRKITCAQVNFFDNEFKKWMDTLISLNMWDNTIIIWSSDNGGLTGDNYPLRGIKTTGYEGGYRCPAFINGGYLPDNRRGIVSSDLFHITDWFPTFLTMSGMTNYKSYNFDGIDQSKMILSGNKGIRNTILLNIDNYKCTTIICGGIIWNNWKLAIGNDLSSDNAGQSGWPSLNGNYGTPTVNCNGIQPDWDTLYNSNECSWNGKGCLWNLDSDPCEYNDVKEENIEIYKFLWNLLLKYNESIVLPLAQIYENSSEIEQANPVYFNGFWSPWQDTLEDKKSVNLPSENWYKFWNFAIALA